MTQRESENKCVCKYRRRIMRNDATDPSPCSCFLPDLSLPACEDVPCLRLRFRVKFNAPPAPSAALGRQTSAKKRDPVYPMSIEHVEYYIYKKRRQKNPKLMAISNLILLIFFLGLRKQSEFLLIDCNRIVYGRRKRGSG